MNPSRAAPRAAAALLLALLAAAPQPAAGAEVATPIPSGLAWRSGADGDPDFGGWRGRPLDARVLYAPHDTLASVRAYLGGAGFAAGCRQAPLCAVSLPLLTADAAQQFQRCAGGEFDATFAGFGRQIAANGRPDAVVRLGWAANSGSRPWGLRSAGQVEPYKRCFRRLASALKAGAAGLLIEWANAAKTPNTAIRVLDTYPGDDAVDLWGVHYRDADPRKTTQAIWDQHVGATFNGGPWGLRTWLAAARAHGKKLAVSNWGVWANGEPGNPDNPLYVRNMHGFFAANAAGIAYEAYHNAEAAFQLTPGTGFPQARAAYLSLWGEDGGGSVTDPALTAALAEINRLRAQAGVAALRLESRLTAAAQGHADDMAAKGYFSHTSLDGRTFDQRIRAAGYTPFAALGENIARGQRDWQAAIAGWMNSPGHRANMLSAQYKDLGLGAKDGYWVQDFGALPSR